MEQDTIGRSSICRKDADRHNETSDATNPAGAVVIPFPAHRVKAPPRVLPVPDPEPFSRKGPRPLAPTHPVEPTHAASITPARSPERKPHFVSARSASWESNVRAEIVAHLTSLAIETAPEGHPATTSLATLGGIAGFAAQQSLLVRGPSHWTQPMRAEHLDRLLVANEAVFGGTPGPSGSALPSLWMRLKDAAGPAAADRLPNPIQFLAAAQKCVGTSQLGVITLPPQHRLAEQPQTGLTRLWARARQSFDANGVDCAHWPAVTAAAAATPIPLTAGRVPLPVARRLVMQSALSMALIEPRQIPGAALR